MSKDDQSPRSGRLGQTLPRYSVLAEAFGAAIDGASRMTRTRAKQLAERLLSQAGLENVDLEEAASGASTRINQLAEEIIAARKANQALLQRTVAAELEKSLHRLGFARADDVDALRSEVATLRNEVAELTIVAGSGAAAGREPAAATTPPAKKAAAKKAPAKKAPAKKTAAKKTPATKQPTTKTAATTASKTTEARS